MTDHSLIILRFSSDANIDGSVLCEIPWLGLAEMDSEELNSSDLFDIPNQSPFKVSFLTLLPKVDMTALPTKVLDTLKKKAEAANKASEHLQVPISDRFFSSSYLPHANLPPREQEQPKPRYTGRGHANSPAQSKPFRSMGQTSLPGHKDHQPNDSRTETEDFLFFKPEERYQANPWFKPPPSAPPPSGWMVGPRALGEGVEDTMLQDQQNAWRLWQQQKQKQQEGRISVSSPANEAPQIKKGLYCSGPEWKSVPVSIEYPRNEAAMKPLSVDEKRKLAVKQQVHSTPNLLTWVEEQSIQWQREQGRAGGRPANSFWLPNQRPIHSMTRDQIPPDAQYVVSHRPLEPQFQPPQAPGSSQPPSQPRSVPHIAYSQPPNGIMPHDPNQPPPYIIQSQGYGQLQQPPSSYSYEIAPARQHGDSYTFPYHDPDRKQRFEQEEALKARFAVHRAKDGPINFSTFRPPDYVTSHLDRLPPPDQRQALPPPVLQPKRDECWSTGDDDPLELSPEDMLEGDTLPGYALKFFTIEPHSLIFHHIQKAWLGAHLRLGMTAAGKSGLPFW